MRRAFVPLCLLLAAPAARAQSQEVYTWTDEAGEVHYTNQLDQVPGRYRRTMKAAKGGEVGEVSAKKEPNPPGEPKIQQKVEPEIVPARALKKPALDEQYWRTQFRAVRDEIARLEEQLAKDKQSLPFYEKYRTMDPNGFLVENPEAPRCRQRIRDNEARLQSAHARLRGLKETGGAAGIPTHWTEG